MPRTASRRWALLALATVLAVTLVAAPVAAHAGGTFPDSGSEVQNKLQDLYDLVGWMAIATSVIVGLLLAYVCVKFYDPEARGESDWFLHNTRLEVTWTVGTLLVLVFLGVVTAQTMYEIETSPLEEGEEAIEVAILGQQWQWRYYYPDGNTSTDTLYMQENTTFKMYSVSCDIVHSVYVPQLGVKIDTEVMGEERCERLKQHNEIPDDPTLNSFWLSAYAGNYRMSCAEFCGRGHAEMVGDIEVFEKGARDKPYGPPPEKGKEFHLEITGSAEDPTLAPSNVTLNTGDLTTWYVHNNATGSRTLTVGGYGVTTGAIPAGSSAEIRFTAADEGSYEIRVEGTPTGGLEVSSGEVRHVELNDNPWYVRDGNEFEPGESYAIKVYNNGSIPHNLFIGTYTPDRDEREALFETETFDAGEFRWLNVTMPAQNATLDWWCDVPGHAEAGMLDQITVGAGGMAQEAASQGRDLVAGFGALVALGGLGAAAWVARRRW